MIPISANYVFLPWVRQGAASGIQAPDSLAANQAGVVSLSAKLRINDADDVERQVRLYGPGDITGIDPQQVVRTEPSHLATGFEPNYFPAIEFDRPDFPWLFTPAKANDDGKLRPWLCLVVVRKQQGVALRVDRSLPLPVLEFTTPARFDRELPDLSESWAWVHAQVAGSRREAGSLKQSLAGDPALTVSRLLCPRRLDPLTDYFACVVPAFRLGCLAGLGLPILPEDEQPPLGLAPAWDVRTAAPPEVRLPVYFHWEFRTGDGGDFETLVRLLEARKMPDEVGKRRMDISEPGFTIDSPPPPGTALELEGALRVPEAPIAAWPDEVRKPFQADLKKILDAPWLAMKDGTDPLLAPPIYGGWQAARHTVNVPPAAQTWLDQLNLDPRGRATAALGTRVVQAEQEQLMASAWEQLGEIQRINQLRRQAQLGRAVNAVYHTRHFSRFSEETLLKVASAGQARLVVTETVNNVSTAMMLSQRISQSALPERAVSAPLRRLTSATSVISARFVAAGAPPIGMLSMFNGTIVVHAERPAPGLVTINDVSAQATVFPQVRDAVRFEQLSNALNTGPQLGAFKVVSEGDTSSSPLAALFPLVTGGSPVGLPDNPDALAFRNTAKEMVAYLAEFFTVPDHDHPLPLPQTKVGLLASLDPRKTITARVQASFTIASGVVPQDDPLEPIMDAPDFPQPMYEALRDLSQDFLFPGLAQVPANTVTLLETNSTFVESYLVGLNTEMSSELLWRNYPTDQRGTYFRQFWGSEQPEIDLIRNWGDRQLGDNAHAGEELVLLVRGELLRRYPNSVIYAVAAVRNHGLLDLSPDPDDERHPLFRGTLNPDVTFLGFDLKRDDAIGEPGWFFVIQQQPTEPRFGLDEADFVKPLPPLTTWSNLSWRHLAGTVADLQALSHASIKTVLPDVDKGKWGRNSAHQAYITLQRPVRIAIHAREMIP